MNQSKLDNLSELKKKTILDQKTFHFFRSGTIIAEIRAERSVMVAINNNLSSKFKIVDSNLSSDKTNELFAELFALMSSSLMSDEHFTENNKEKLASVISEKALINQNINKKANSQFPTDSEKGPF